MAASKCNVRWPQFAQANVALIAPLKGSEHFAQNGGTIRTNFASQSPHRYSPALMFAEQIAQTGGERSEATALTKSNFDSIDIFRPRAHQYPRQSGEGERHDSHEKIFAQPG